MTTYLLNSPVLTSFGQFEFRQATLAEIRTVLADGFESAVGHASTADALSHLLGVDIPFRRATISMQPGDRAVVFRLLHRPAEGEVLSRDQILASPHAWGLLEAQANNTERQRKSRVRVFLSYDRTNVRVARHLCRDLNRAGLQAWLDLDGIAPDSPRWAQVIEAEIRASDLVIVLASPESVDSANVTRELQTAVDAERPIARLLVGGETEKLPEAWRDSQLSDFSRRPYDVALRDFMQRMWPDLEVPVSLMDLLSDPEFDDTAAAAADHLGVDRTPQWIEGVRYIALPLFVSGYTATDLLLPEDAKLTLPDELRLLVHTTGQVEDKASSVLKDAIAKGERPWLLYLRGNVVKGDKESYDIPFEKLHIWDDTAAAVMRCLIGSPFYERRVDLYFYGPAALAFEVGGRNREMGKHSFFAWDRDKQRYVDIRWKRSTSHR